MEGLHGHVAAAAYLEEIQKAGETSSWVGGCDLSLELMDAVKRGNGGG